MLNQGQSKPCWWSWCFKIQHTNQALNRVFMLLTIDKGSGDALNSSSFSSLKGVFYCNLQQTTRDYQFWSCWAQKFNLFLLIARATIVHWVCWSRIDSSNMYDWDVLFDGVYLWYSLLSKFRKSFLPPICNGLFAILFKILLERVSGSDSANKLFYRLIYGLFTIKKVDFGTVIWNHFAQSVNSTTRHMEISCARFWSIVVKRALLHYKVPEVTYSLTAEIPMMQTTTFVTTNPRNFDFVGPIPEVMM